MLPGPVQRGRSRRQERTTLRLERPRDGSTSAWWRAHRSLLELLVARVARRRLVRLMLTCRGLEGAQGAKTMTSAPRAIVLARCETPERAARSSSQQEPPERATRKSHQGEPS